MHEVDFATGINIRVRKCKVASSKFARLKPIAERRLRAKVFKLRNQ